MKKTPPGWPRLSASVYYEDPAAAIDWLCRAFGFTVRIKIVGEGGRIEHSELEYGEGLVMVGGLTRRPGVADQGWRASPRGLDGKSTQSLMLFVDDADAHCARARAAGATIVSEPTTSDYGPEYWADRGYEVRDLEGHHWYIAHRIKTSAAELARHAPPAKKKAKAKARRR